jgi:hypothetical protein
MPDITMCKDAACPMAENCYRFKAEPNGAWQSFFTESPRKKDNTCDHYWPMKEKAT